MRESLLDGSDLVHAANFNSKSGQIHLVNDDCRFSLFNIDAI